MHSSLVESNLVWYSLPLQLAITSGISAAGLMLQRALVRQGSWRSSLRRAAVASLGAFSSMGHGWQHLLLVPTCSRRSSCRRFAT